MLTEQDVRDLEPVLVRFALRATRERDAARDLAQEALLAAVAQREGFGERSSLRTWVVGILAHKVIDHLRRRARERARQGDEDDDPDLLEAPARGDVERVVAARQELAAVDRALRELPERERLALLMLDVEGLDRDETCNALGVTPTHLRVIVHRGRHRLRRLLEHGVNPLSLRA